VADVERRAGAKDGIDAGERVGEEAREIAPGVVLDPQACGCAPLIVDAVRGIREEKPGGLPG